MEPVEGALLWLNARLGQQMTVKISYPGRVVLAVTGRLMRWPEDEAVYDHLGYSIGGYAQVELSMRPGAARIEQDGEYGDFERLVIDLGRDAYLAVAHPEAWPED